MHVMGMAYAYVYDMESNPSEQKTYTIVNYF